MVSHLDNLNVMLKHHVLVGNVEKHGRNRFKAHLGTPGSGIEHFQPNYVAAYFTRKPPAPALCGAPAHFQESNRVPYMHLRHFYRVDT